MRRVTVRQDHFHNKNAAFRCHCPPTVSENGDALLFTEVVNDVRQYVSIAPGRDRLEKITRFDDHAILDATLLEELRCAD
jgi:hypothetical protein